MSFSTEIFRDNHCMVYIFKQPIFIATLFTTNICTYSLTKLKKLTLYTLALSGRASTVNTTHSISDSRTLFKLLIVRCTIFWAEYTKCDKKDQNLCETEAMTPQWILMFISNTYFVVFVCTNSKMQFDMNAFQITLFSYEGSVRKLCWLSPNMKRWHLNSINITS